MESRHHHLDEGQTDNNLPEGDMVSMTPPAYCHQCGSPLQEGDRFCGTCGAAVLFSPPQAEQVIPQQEAASYAPSRGRRLPWALGVSVLAILIVGTGALAVVAFQDGLGFLNGSDPGPVAELSGREETTSQGPTPEDETSTEASVSPDTPPDPAFDELLPTLKQMTDAPIMLPADLPEGLQYVAVDSGTSGDEYAVFFLNEEAENGEVTQQFGGAFVRGEISVEPSGPGPQFPDYGSNMSMTPLGTVSLPDGPQATVNYYDPETNVPFTVGGFVSQDETSGQNYLYLVTVERDTQQGDLIKQVLTSMVSVPDGVEGSAEPEATTTAGETFEQQFVSAYYDAVAREDWDTTYSLLSNDSKMEFTSDEWYEAQEARVAATNPLPLESATLQNTAENSVGFQANVLLSYSDGSEETVPIEVVYGDGGLKRNLSEEDISYLEGFLSQGDGPDTSVGTLSVEQFVYDYYATVEREDWSATYSMLADNSQAEFTEDEWIEKQERRQEIAGSPAPVESVAVRNPEDYLVNPTFTATVAFTDGTSVDILVVDPHDNTGLLRILTDEEIEYLNSL